MPVARWQPGNLYQPGAVVQPTLSGTVVRTPPGNAGFESGDTGWVKGTGWAIENQTGFAGAWRGAFQPGGVFGIAGVVADAAVFSVDGQVWAGKTPPGGGALSGATRVAYSSSLSRLCVAHGVTNRSYTSDDGGDTWAGPFATGITLRALTWSERLGLFFIGGDAGSTIRSSADGQSWTERLTGSVTVSDFAESGAELVAVSQSSRTVLRSTDGVTWAEHTLALPDLGFRGVAWAPALGLFCAVQNAGKTATSPDGIVWTERNVSGIDAISVAWSEPLGLFAAVDVGVSANFASTSPDGVNWTARAAISANWADVIWHEPTQRFVAISASNVQDIAMSSTDGISWTSHTLPTESGDVRWGNITSLDALLGIQALINDTRAVVDSGLTTITAKGFIRSTGSGEGRVGVAWYNAVDALIKIDWSTQIITGQSNVWKLSSVTATAPENAATASFAFGGSGTDDVVYVDEAEWDHVVQNPVSEVIFKAVQADAGFSATSEPDWPETVGLQVVDNEVTWEAVQANRVVWKAVPILVSGATEPNWPDESGGFVADNTIVWEAATRRVEDENCPNTKFVAIASSKIFSGDDDIVAFSATVNPLDWSTRNDAGFIPFGLNTYGSQPVSALGIYRSNLVIFNNKAFQMWQVDEDPANFAILDAVPVGCPFYRSLQAVSNDLVFLTQEGIRSMGIAGASTNLAAGFFGKQIDPLVTAAIKAGTIPNSLYYPGAGQYWLFFGPEAFVLTMNGGSSDMSWSRYVFPSDIDDWTILNSELYLRSGDKIWRVSDDATLDDQVGTGMGKTGTAFIGRVWWPYLDFGALAVEKQMVGFDIVADGDFTVSIGYNQKDDAQVTAPHSLSGDTLPGDTIPMPVSAPSFQFRLEFSGDQIWEWSATALWVNNFRATS